VPKNLGALLEKVSTATPSELAELWQVHLGGICPEHPLIRRHLSAWRLQAQAHGGLSSRTRRRLRELDTEFRRDPNFRPQGVAPLKPGTEFIRIWKDQTHRVRVTQEGFVYQSHAYKSLSEIARQITGTRWSGPKFFAVKRSMSPG
jgi:hypothetical protein